MIELRPFASLGHANHGWLDARHHFSFGRYRDPSRKGWGRLRVWNDDEIAPRHGFPAHGHRDMEIITYVRQGAITHEDSLGNHGRTEAGDVQVMSAGSGIRHAEHNHEAGPTTLFQIWIEPTVRCVPPAWGTRPFPRADRAGRFIALASGCPKDEEALPIVADARVCGALLKAGESTDYQFGAGRHVYLVAARGTVEVNGVRLGPRDGAAIHDEAKLEVKALEEAELVLVDTV